MEPARVLITGAAGQIGYILANWIANGDLFNDRKVILHLYGLERSINRLQALQMELQDSALHGLQDVIASSDMAVAFKDVDVAFLLASVPLAPGAPRSDILPGNAMIMKETGEALSKYAKKDVKVLVIGNPCNTNALIASLYADRIPKENFHSLSMLDHNRATSAVAQRLGVSPNDIKNVVVWGNHGDSMVPDLSHAYYSNKGVRKEIIKELGEEWAHGEFAKYITTRGPSISLVRGKPSSAPSAAHAALKHMQAWIYGTNEVISMGIHVPENNSYGLRPGIVYSLPCTVGSDGVPIVEDLEVDNWTLSKMKETELDLWNERQLALKALEQF